MKYQLCSSDLVLNEANALTLHDPVLQKDLPYTFKCRHEGIKLNPKRPVWINQEFPSPVFWCATPLSNTNKSLNVIQQRHYLIYMNDLQDYPVGKDDIIEPRDVSQMKDWTIVVNDKGELIILHINPKPLYKTYMLSCYIKKYRRRDRKNDYYGIPYAGGIVFDGTITDDRQPLRPISPRWRNVTLYWRRVIINCRPVY